MSSEKKGWLSAKVLLVLVLAGVGAFTYFVPVRDCPSCLGTGGIPVGNLGCKQCGGDGKQTLFEIGMSKVRKSVGN